MASPQGDSQYFREIVQEEVEFAQNVRCRRVHRIDLDAVRVGKGVAEDVSVVEGRHYNRFGVFAGQYGRSVRSRFHLSVGFDGYHVKVGAERSHVLPEHVSPCRMPDHDLRLFSPIGVGDPLRFRVQQVYFGFDLGKILSVL